MPPPVIDQSRSSQGPLATEPLATLRHHKLIEPKFTLLDFTKQTMRTPASIGAIAPSSRSVAQKCGSTCQFK